MSKRAREAKRDLRYVRRLLTRINVASLLAHSWGESLEEPFLVPEDEYLAWMRHTWRLEERGIAARWANKYGVMCGGFAIFPGR